jgi:hypothetical protein
MNPMSKPVMVVRPMYERVRIGNHSFYNTPSGVRFYDHVLDMEFATRHYPILMTEV